MSLIPSLPFDSNIQHLSNALFSQSVHSIIIGKKLLCLVMANQTSPTSNPTTPSFVPGRSHPRSGMRGPTTCEKCKKPGHLARDCNARKCWTCGRYGHLQNDCWQAGPTTHSSTQAPYAGTLAQIAAAAQAPRHRPTPTPTPTPMAARAARLPIRCEECGSGSHMKE